MIRNIQPKLGSNFLKRNTQSLKTHQVLLRLQKRCTSEFFIQCFYANFLSCRTWLYSFNLHLYVNVINAFHIHYFSPSSLTFTQVGINSSCLHWVQNNLIVNTFLSYSSMLLSDHLLITMSEFPSHVFQRPFITHNVKTLTSQTKG